MITNAAQQAFDLVARVLLEPDDVVAVEDPGFPPLHRALKAHAARVVGVPVDNEGIVVEALPAAAKLVYVRPQNQFPLGVTMSHERRLRLLQWAERVGAAIVEDDRGAEFSHGGPAPETLRSLDRSGRVLFVSSFSQALLPMVRLGFVVAPPSLHTALRKAKLAADGHVDVPAQAAMAKFIEDGSLARHLRRVRALLGDRHQAIVNALADELGDYLVPIPSTAGRRVTALFTTATDDAAVARLAASAGVAVHHLSVFGLERAAQPGLIFGYSGIPVDRIPAGLLRVRECVEWSARPWKRKRHGPTVVA